MEKFKLAKIAKYLSVAGTFEGEIENFAFNSKDVKKGTLFFALKGEKNDGHAFLKDVAIKGGKAAVVSKEYQGEDFGLTLLTVDDVLTSMQHLARCALQEKPRQIVGITGSVGKTTIKEFTATLLSLKFRVAKNESSHNSQISFPVTILNLLNNSDAEVLVLEYGMSCKGEITKLVEIAAPDIALVSKVALAHAANFPEGLSGIAKAKAEIFSNAQKTKCAIVNHYLLSFKGIFPQNHITFSTIDPEADFFLHMVNENIRIDEKGIRMLEVKFPFKEVHFQEDFLAAASICRAMDMSWEEISEQIDKLTLPKMRFEKISLNGVLFINDAYNANMESMKAALRSLPPSEHGGKRIAVLGEMRELGDFSPNCHEEVGKEAIGFVDHLLCLGNACQPMKEAFETSKKPAELFLSQESMATRLKDLMTPGDVVLVKGSRSMSMEKIFELIKTRT